MTDPLEGTIKQRIIGAAVLVALAVIFLPMLLDGDSDRFGTVRDDSFPEPPEFKMQTRILQLGDDTQEQLSELQKEPIEDPIVWEDASATDGETIHDLLPPSAAPEGAAPSTDIAEREAGIVADLNGLDELPQEPAQDPPPELEKTSNLPPVVDRGSEKAPENVPETTGVITQQTANTSARGWYIQAASFGKQSNARSLVSKLRKKGWPAGEEPVTVNQRRIFRVYTGPFKNKAEATTEQSRLEKAFVLGKTRIYRRGAADLAVISGQGSEQKDGKLTSGWSVQVGNFGNSVNAEKLRSRVAKSGFDAYVEVITGATARSYRVRIGPVLERREAENLKSRINSKLKLSGFVVSHP